MVHDKSSAVLLYRTKLNTLLLTWHYNGDGHPFFWLYCTLLSEYYCTIVTGVVQLLIDICNSVNFNITKCNF